MGATARAKGLIFEAWLRTHTTAQVGVSTLQAKLFEDYRLHAGEAAFAPASFQRGLTAAGFAPLKCAEGVYRQGVRLKAAYMTPLTPAAVVALAGRDDVDTAHDGDGAAVVADEAPAVVQAANARIDRYPPRQAGKTAGIWRDQHVTVGHEQLVLHSPNDDCVITPDIVSVHALAPYAGGPAVQTVVLEMPDEEDRASALIAGELYVARRRQRADRNYLHSDDDALPPGELASMAAAMAYAASVPPKWLGWLKGRAPDEGRELQGYPVLAMLRPLWRRSLETFKAASPRAMLVTAGALIIAAIEILDRKAAREKKEETSNADA